MIYAIGFVSGVTFALAGLWLAMRLDYAARTEEHRLKVEHNLRTYEGLDEHASMMEKRKAA